MAGINVTPQMINEYRALIGNFVLSDSKITEMIQKDIETGKLPKEFATLATDAQKVGYNANTSNLFGFGFNTNTDMGLSFKSTAPKTNQNEQQAKKIASSVKENSRWYKDLGGSSLVAECKKTTKDNILYTLKEFEKISPDKNLVLTITDNSTIPVEKQKEGLKHIFNVLCDLAKDKGVDTTHFEKAFKTNISQTRTETVTNRNTGGDSYSVQKEVLTKDNINTITNIIVGLRNSIEVKATPNIYNQITLALTPKEQIQEQTIGSLKYKHSLSLEALENQNRYDGWAGELADWMSGAWSSKNREKLVRADLEKFNAQIAELENAKKVSKEGFKQKFEEIFGIKYDAELIVNYQQVEQLYQIATSCYQLEQFFKSDLNVLLSNPILREETKTVSIDPMTSLTQTTVLATKEQVFEREFNKLANFVGQGNLENGKQQLEGVFKASGITETSTLQEKYTVLRKIAQDYAKALHDNTKQVTGNKGYDAIAKDFDDAYKSAFGVTNDIARRVAEYNVSQQAGAGVIKSAIMIGGTIALGAITGGAGLSFFPVLAITSVGAGAITATTEFSDRLTSGYVFQGFKENGIEGAIEGAKQALPDEEIIRILKSSGITTLAVATGGILGAGVEIGAQALNMSILTKSLAHIAVGTGVGAGAEYLHTGTVSVQGVVFAFVLSATGQVLARIKVGTMDNGKVTFDKQAIKQARQDLGLADDVVLTKEVLKNAYRKMSFQAHPDQGGTAEAFVKVKTAYDLLRQYAQPATATGVNSSSKPPSNTTSQTEVNPNMPVVVGDNTPLTYTQAPQTGINVNPSRHYETPTIKEFTSVADNGFSREADIAAERINKLVTTDWLKKEMGLNKGQIDALRERPDILAAIYYMQKSMPEKIIGLKEDFNSFLNESEPLCSEGFISRIEDIVKKESELGIQGKLQDLAERSIEEIDYVLKLDSIESIERENLKSRFKPVEGEFDYRPLLDLKTEDGQYKYSKNDIEAFKSAKIDPKTFDLDNVKLLEKEIKTIDNNNNSSIHTAIEVVKSGVDIDKAVALIKVGVVFSKNIIALSNLENFDNALKLAATRTFLTDEIIELSAKEDVSTYVDITKFKDKYGRKLFTTAQNIELVEAGVSKEKIAGFLEIVDDFSIPDIIKLSKSKKVTPETYKKIIEIKDEQGKSKYSTQNIISLVEEDIKLEDFYHIASQKTLDGNKYRFNDIDHIKDLAKIYEEKPALLNKLLEDPRQLDFFSINSMLNCSKISPELLFKMLDMTRQDGTYLFHPGDIDIIISTAKDCPNLAIKMLDIINLDGTFDFDLESTIKGFNIREDQNITEDMYLNLLKNNVPQEVIHKILTNKSTNSSYIIYELLNSDKKYTDLESLIGLKYDNDYQKEALFLLAENNIDKQFGPLALNDIKNLVNDEASLDVLKTMIKNETLDASTIIQTLKMGKIIEPIKALSSTELEHLKSSIIKETQLDKIIIQVYPQKQGYDTNIALSKKADILLQLKLDHPNRYQRLLDSGLYELMAEGKIPSYLILEIDENSFLSNRVLNEIARIRDGREQILSLKSSEELANISKHVPNGEVCECNGKLYVNDNGNPIEIKLSKEKFEELFPPLSTTLFRQGGSLGDCWLVSTLDSFMDLPKGRVELYKLFEQRGNDVLIKFPESPNSILFSNGEVLNTIYCQLEVLGKSSKQPIGLQMIEQAAAIHRYSKYDKTTDITKITKFSTSTSELMEELRGGTNLEAINILTKNIAFRQRTSFLGNKGIDIELEFKNLITQYANDENTLLHFGTTAAKRSKYLPAEYNITVDHAYTIKAYDESKGMVYISNPHNTSTIIEIPLYELIKYIEHIDVATFK